MANGLSRRAVLAAGPAAMFVLSVARTEGETSVEGAKVWGSFPSHDPELVAKAVGAAHGRLDQLRALVDPMPELAKAAYDWGYGDWEDCIGAASHVGSRECALYLLERGARPTLFTHAMLGHVEVVKATIGAQPGIERLAGPHGISLLRHAQAGGEQAKAVVEYLDQLGVTPPEPEQLTEERAKPFIGEYSFGPAADERFIVEMTKMGLAISRSGFPSRRMTLNGGSEFHPVGARSVLLRFTLESGRATSVSVHGMGEVVVARRVGV